MTTVCERYGHSFGSRQACAICSEPKPKDMPVAFYITNRGELDT